MAGGVEDVGIAQWGRAAIAMTTGNYTLVQAEWENRILELSGAIGAARNLVLPAALDGMEWIVFNNTSGGFAVTFLVSGQTGVAVAAGKRAILYCNATDIVRVTTDT